MRLDWIPRSLCCIYTQSATFVTCCVFSSGLGWCIASHCIYLPSFWEAWRKALVVNHRRGEGRKGNTPTHIHLSFGEVETSRCSRGGGRGGGGGSRRPVNSSACQPSLETKAPPAYTARSTGPRQYSSLSSLAGVIINPTNMVDGFELALNGFNLPFAMNTIASAKGHKNSRIHFCSMEEFRRKGKSLHSLDQRILKSGKE